MTDAKRRRSPITIQQSPAANLVGALSCAGLTIVFCLILLVHDPLVFWNDDYEISILPVCADIARAWSHGEFPLLSPYSWVCGNLAGEFQYGVFSLFVSPLIVAIWQLPLTFSQQAGALSISHLAVLAGGGFMLARGRGFSPANSILVSLVCSLNGWIICWGASDWFGALSAFTWLPWCWWAAERALDPRRSRWRFLWPAPFVYLLIAGGFPYTVLMLAVVLIWLTTRTLAEHRRERHFLTRFGPMASGVLLGVGMSAPAWLAVFDYVKGSARELQPASAHWQWIVPWAALPGFILPSWTVNWADFSTRYLPHTATELACGMVVPAILIAAFIRRGPIVVSRIKWELLLAAFVLAACMSPTAGLFRWSFRWLPLFHLLVVLCAAQWLEMTADRTTRSSGLLQSPSIFALFTLGGLIFVSSVLGTNGKYLFPLAWILMLITALWVVLEAQPIFLLRRWAPTAITFASLLATYLCIPPNCGVPRYNLPQTLLRAEPLDPARLYLSFYPPAEEAYTMEKHPASVGETVRPGSVSMWAGVRLINGYSPIRPSGVAREFATGIHGEIDLNMAQWLCWSEAHSDGLLERLGVDGIIVANEFDVAPLPANEWQLVATSVEGRVFHRRVPPLARVRSVDWFGKHATAKISDVVEKRNCVSARVEVAEGDEAALLAFSRPFFRGYRTEINGRIIPVSSIRSLIPLVELPPGTRGQLSLVYRPAWLIYGGAIALTCAIIWLVSALLAWRTLRRSQ